jgi:hypothetical protein
MSIRLENSGAYLQSVVIKVEKSQGLTLKHKCLSLSCVYFF